MDDLQENILKQHKIIINTYQDNKISDIPALLNTIKEITSIKEGSIIQLLKTDYIMGINHLKQAIAQTFKAFNEKQNFANDMGVEICVRLSTQKQISEAFKLLGITEKGNITVVYIDTNEKQVEEVEKLLATKNNELLEEYGLNTIKEAYNVPDNEDNVLDYINEQIALLTIKT